MIQKKGGEIAKENTCFLVLQKINHLSEDFLYLVKKEKDKIFVSGSQEEQVEFLEKLVDGITEVMKKTWVFKTRGLRSKSQNRRRIKKPTKKVIKNALVKYQSFIFLLNCLLLFLQFF